MGDSYTTVITLTVPAGRYCRTRRQWCRFLVEMFNHPGYYCFLIPESYWDQWQDIRKHPKCPSLNQLPKTMKGETPEVMKRLYQFKDLMKSQ